MKRLPIILLAITMLAAVLVLIDRSGGHVAQATADGSVLLSYPPEG